MQFTVCMRLTDWLDDSISACEQQVLLRDGDVFGNLLIDAPTTWMSRLGILSVQVPRDMAICSWSAAWVHLGNGTQPPTLHVCPGRGQRPPRLPRHVFTVHESRLSPDELFYSAHGSVTSPLRTIKDLARFAIYESKDRERELLATMQLLALLDGQAFNAEVNHVRGLKPSARLTLPKRRLLALADAIDVIDSVDASNSVEHAIEMHGVTHFEHETTDSQSVG